MKKTIFCFLIVMTAACKEAYSPPVNSTNNAYLVVEGFINNGPDSTIIAISDSYSLKDSVNSAPELGATVDVEGSDNSIYHLGEIGNGSYGAELSTLNIASQYRLHIVTSGGKEYRSDFVAFKTSPPIDSISWVRKGDGVQIYANTHDPQNASKYYLWKYEETWQFNSVYFSEYEYLPPPNDTIVTRLASMGSSFVADSIYTCWTGDQSNNILLGSSTKLAQDLIYEAPLVLVPNNSWHISVAYSILVKQYVLTEDGYNFWLTLKQNTEQIGSIFSPQPSQLHGNIHSLSNPEELVIGYVSAGSLQQQRIFINPDSISNWTVNNYPNSCYQRSIIGIADSEYVWLSSNQFIPTTLDFSINEPPLPPFRFLIAPDVCVDCTQVGTNVKPSYWP